MLSTLHGSTPAATCELGEVAPTEAMQGDAAAQAPPRPAHVGVGLRPGPLLEGLFADLEQHSAAALTLLAHGMHAPLVGCFSAAPTRNDLDDFDLFAVLFDQMADVDDALVAGVGALQAGVVRLYGIVVILRWLRGCARLLCGHEVLSRGPGPGGYLAVSLRGHLYYPTILAYRCL